jgi:20S proteasome alpha/beta subunit
MQKSYLIFSTIPFLFQWFENLREAGTDPSPQILKKSLAHLLHSNKKKKRPLKKSLSINNSNKWMKA